MQVTFYVTEDVRDEFTAGQAVTVSRGSSTYGGTITEIVLVGGAVQPHLCLCQACLQRGHGFVVGFALRNIQRALGGFLLGFQAVALGFQLIDGGFQLFHIF